MKYSEHIIITNSTFNEHKSIYGCLEIFAVESVQIMHSNFTNNVATMRGSVIHGLNINEISIFNTNFDNNNIEIPENMYEKDQFEGGTMYLKNL